ncbi:MAG: hypothetical protein KF788_10695 [Piscinibacter sp.]|nr:hypothetical protein [Piscinibacter sp.]
MNLTTGESSDEFFGGAVPPAVRDLLHQAARAAPAGRSALLWSAQAIAPPCLAVYYALYKHHAGRREFELAERAAWRGLQEAAAQAGLDDDWRRVQPPLTADVRASRAGRFWLFTLKALAFIHLRTDRPAQAQALLETLQACDPQAGNGSEVTAALLAAARPPR